jgi:Na+-driven multidrug efflux pump
VKAGSAFPFFHAVFYGGKEVSMKKEESRNRMETRAMGPLVWSMALPMMVSLLIQSLYNIVDSVFVARLGQEALTAASLACPVQMLMIAAGVGTAVGVNAILSRTLGMKNYGEASRIAQTGLALSAAWALFFAAAGLAFAGRLAEIFTDDPGISAQCASYLRICMAFCLGNLVCMVSSVFSRHRAGQALPWPFWCPEP